MNPGSEMTSSKAPPTLRHLSVALAALTLVVGVVLQFLSFTHATHASRGAHLTQFIPQELSGWRSVEVPLGPNEFISNEAEKILNFDEKFYRQYSREGRSFTVYAAYWSAGKMPMQLVASHTPDRCWTENGWNCLEMRFRQTGLFPGESLQPAEWRLFQAPNNGPQTYVVYWHLVNGSAYDYGSRFNSVPNPWLWCKGAVQQALEGKAEQYFIRIASEEPFEALSNDPGFRSLVRGLAQLGLSQSSNVANLP